MNFPDVNEVISLVAAELRDKYDDSPSVYLEKSDPDLVLGLPTQTEDDPTKLHYDTFVGKDEFLTPLIKISKQLKSHFDGDKDHVIGPEGRLIEFDVRTVVLAETIQYTMMRQRQTMEKSKNDYHSRLLLATAKFNSNLLYDCITYTLNDDFRSYEKEMITKMLTRNSEMNETILVFFEPKMRRHYKRSYCNYMHLKDRSENLSHTISCLLEYSRHHRGANTDWVLQFLSSMFLQLNKIVQDLFPSKYKIIHPIPILIIYMMDKISTKTIADAHYMNEIYRCDYEWTANIMLLPDLTLPKAIICTLYGTKKAIEEDEHAMEFMMALSKRYEDSKNDHEIVETLNLCLNLYRQHTTVHGLGQKFVDLMVWWTEHFKGLYKMLSPQSRDRIFKHVIKQQIDGFVDRDTILNWSKIIIDRKSNRSEEVRHCGSLFMSTESWKIYFDMRIEKKQLMDRFYDDSAKQSCRDFCLLNDNYCNRIERLRSYRDLFEGVCYCPLCFQERQYFYVPPCCANKYCDHCVRKYIKSKVVQGGVVNWERTVPCPHCKIAWKRTKTLDQDARFIKETVHDEVDSFFLALVYLHSPVHKLPYHPSIVGFFSDGGIHLQTQKEETMKNMRYFPQAWNRTFSPIVPSRDSKNAQVSIFETDMKIALLTPRDGGLEPFYVDKPCHFAHRKITVGDIYDYLPKATVIDDPSKKFVVGLDSDKVFFYRPQITIKCANMDVVKKIWYHQGSCTEKDKRSSVHEDLLPFCQLKLDHHLHDSDMIACVNDKEQLLQCEVFPIIISSTPLEGQQRVWKTVITDFWRTGYWRNDFIATTKKLSEDLDDNEIPRIGSVWELEAENCCSKKRKRDDEVLYLCEKVSCHDNKLTVILLPMLFLPPEQCEENKLFVKMLYNSQYNGTFYDRMEAHCKVTRQGLEMETLRKPEDWILSACKKKRWRRRKEREEFYCLHKEDKEFRIYAHNVVDINPLKLHAIKGGQYVLSLMHKKIFCMFNNGACESYDFFKSTVIGSIYRDTDTKRKKLYSDDGIPFIVDEPMAHEQRLQIRNNNGQVEISQPFDDIAWAKFCPVNPEYTPVTEDLANSIL